MTSDREKALNSGAKRPIVLSPWLVALAALGLYSLTLNHWVTFASLPFASQLTGWDWHPGPLPWRPNPQYPLFSILTFPLRLLPVGWRVIGLNVFTAACAALTLAILARSVRLLSHDRTEDQRRRERGENGLLSVRAAFLPAALAVLLLGAQLTFWDDAVSGIGEMLDLLVFAFLILCLLEYRISPGERRLNLFALVYGAGVTDNWALIAFFPCFLLALVWIKSNGFFRWKFVLRMAGWGALGLLLYGLIPLLGAAAGDGGFLALLRQKVAEQHIPLTRMPRYYALIASVPTLIPLFFGAIKWPSARYDFAHGARSLTRALVRVLHLVCLALGVLMLFDLKPIPTPRNLEMGVLPGSPGFLSFYYLAALSAGYFSGYVLLVFGGVAGSRRRPATGMRRAVNGVVAGLLWVAAAGLPAILFHENYRRIRDLDSPVVAQFGEELAKAMPAGPAIVLADDPALLHLAMGGRQRLGLPDQYTFVESRSLVHGEYLRYLSDSAPSIGREFAHPERLPRQITDHQAGELVAQLARQQPVYYLHPSFGSLFERVCMTPHCLGGMLHPYPTNILETLALSAPAIVTNQEYWHTLERGSLAGLPALAKRSPDAGRIAAYYSQMLNYWGVELQKIGSRRNLPPLLDDADAQFGEAIRINPGNKMARANQQYNARLRGAPATGPLVTTTTVAAEFNNRWDLALSVDGPPDAPDFDIQIGRYFAQRGAYFQATPLFQRSIELAPGDPAGKLDLINALIDVGLVDAAFVLIKDMREHSEGDPMELLGVEVLANIARNDFAQAEALLAGAHNKNPKDANFAGEMAAFYRLMGEKAAREGKGDAASGKSPEQNAAFWFKKELSALDEHLQLLNARTTGAQEISMINRRRADLQMMAGDYEAAIITLSALAQQDPLSPAPRLNRAICELEIGRLDAARNDYQAVQNMMPEPSPEVYDGLAQIAQKQNDKAAEIRYDKLYLRHAPQNTLQYTNVSQQLRKLEGR